MYPPYTFYSPGRIPKQPGQRVPRVTQALAVAGVLDGEAMRLMVQGFGSRV